MDRLMSRVIVLLAVLLLAPLMPESGVAADEPAPDGGTTVVAPGGQSHPDQGHRGQGHKDKPAPRPDVAWEALTAGQQQMLERFRGQWATLPPERQSRLAAGAARLGDADPAERDDAGRRFRQWQQLTPEQRGAMREQLKEFRRMDPEEQAKVRRNFRRFRQMSPEERRHMQQRWEKLTPAQRQELLDRRRDRHEQRGPTEP